VRADEGSDSPEVRADEGSDSPEDLNRCEHCNATHETDGDGEGFIVLL